jgi:hypothetical protein
MYYHKYAGCAYVLWGEYFDDVIAAIFASALRQGGWRTRLVGLQGATHMGQHGNRLVADISLSEALRSQEPIICVVVPCAPEQLDTQRDGRLGEFLERAGRQQAVFIAKPHIAGASNRHWPPASYTISPHPEEVLPLLHLVIEQLEHAHRLGNHMGNPPEAPTAPAGAPSREGACSSHPYGCASR